ncbi:MAG TPA: permease [Candidatus Binatia bacterium]|nr:permease [Candidatus Binatia bacterium]
MSGDTALHPRPLAWLARQESRLSWRDLVWLMTAGYRWRSRSVAIWLIFVAVAMHFLAYGMVARFAGVTEESGVDAFSAVTGSIGLSFFLMLSQAVEQVTRLFYGRGDLDLLKSSPVSLRRVLGLRVFSVAVSTIAMTVFVAAPFIDVLVLRGGPRWLCAYGVSVAGGLAASGIALVLTAALFDLMGARRTRLASQIVAAVIGSAFIIAIQVVAIVSIGTLSQSAFFQSDVVLAHAPGPQSLLWLPARAILGDPAALLIVAVTGLAIFVAPMLLLAGRLGDYAMAAAAADVATGHVLGKGMTGFFLGRFRPSSSAGLLRRKEWVLLLRDPWLASQSLMQLLYLIPPAIFLWLSYGSSAGGLVVLAPVLTMAAGQLGGGLAWLAVSGEDAPDLIASAPIAPRRMIAAKVESVMIAVLIVFVPFLVAMAGRSIRTALIVAAGIALAAASSTLIQVMFRSQAKRRYFRRRQTSSRIATFAEAFSSVAWAGTAAIAASESWMALGPAAVALLVLTGAWLIRPK